MIRQVRRSWPGGGRGRRTWRRRIQRWSLPSLPIAPDARRRRCAASPFAQPPPPKILSKRSGREFFLRLSFLPAPGGCSNRFQTDRDFCTGLTTHHFMGLIKYIKIINFELLAIKDYLFFPILMSIFHTARGFFYPKISRTNCFILPILLMGLNKNKIKYLFSRFRKNPRN